MKPKYCIILNIDNITKRMKNDFGSAIKFFVLLQFYVRSELVFNLYVPLSFEFSLNKINNSVHKQNAIKPQKCIK